MEHKRRSGARNRSLSGSGKLGVALLIVLTLIVAAVVIVLSPLGDYLLTNVWNPVFSCAAEPESDEKIVSALKAQDEQPKPTETPKPVEKERETITIDETTFYILQMGSFLNADDAETHAAEIRRMGAAGTVMVDGSVYRVFAAAYLDEASLMKVQSQVRSDGFEATPYITESRAMKITLDGDREAVASLREAVAILNDVPASLCGLCLQYDKGELDPDRVKTQLKQLFGTCSDADLCVGRISDASVMPIAGLLAKYEENISTFLREHDTMDEKSLSSELKYLQFEVIKDYISFFDRK